jgi:hypothetical protein
MGRVAVDMLMKRLGAGGADEPSETIAATLVEGSSVMQGTQSPER